MTEPISAYTAVGAWIVRKLRDQFGLSIVIREDGMREGDPDKGYVYQIVPLTDTQLMGGGTGLAKFSVNVAVNDRASSSWALGGDAHRIDVAMIGPALRARRGEALDGGWVLTSSTKEGTFRPPPVVFKGVEFRRLGGTYRVQVQRS